MEYKGFTHYHLYSIAWRPARFWSRKYISQDEFDALPAMLEIEQNFLTGETKFTPKENWWHPIPEKEFPLIDDALQRKAKEEEEEKLKLLEQSQG